MGISTIIVSRPSLLKCRAVTRDLHAIRRDPSDSVQARGATTRRRGSRAATLARALSRLREPPDPDFHRLNASIGFDRRLWPADVAQSRAHVRMLASVGILRDTERDELLAALDRVHDELRDGTFPFREDDEDIHMAVERRVTELAGPVGGKLHTARSRNDQVATDLALYARDAAQAAAGRAGALMVDLLARAEEHLDWPMPGYTHLQRAQPVYLGHHLLAYFWMFERDRRRLRFAAEQAAATLPLGAGALAGVSFQTDRAMVAAELGFAAVAPNSIDAVSNRDFVLDLLGAAATCATHLSRLGAELVLWSSEEFGFCELPDAWTSGSSIMPQKKNPDAAELLRGKAPRVTAHLSAMHGVMHALALTYNKDLQEDKEHLFDAVDTLELMLAAAAGMIRSVTFRRERMLAASSDEMIAATDVADLLVRRGVPFRQAHGIVAGLVRTALDSGRRLSQLTPAELAAASEALDETRGAGDSYHSVLERASWLESKVSQGGTSLARVREQVQLARVALAS